MADGFRVTERLDAAPAAVWAYLTDFAHANAWMTGVEDMTQAGDGPLAVGTRFTFRARGKRRETRVTALDAGKQIALTSTQGGVTATYTYSLVPVGGGTDVTLHAVCTAAGWWRLLHPLIAVAMRVSDSSQLARLKAALERTA